MFESLVFNAYISIVKENKDKISEGMKKKPRMKHRREKNTAEV